MMYRTAEFKKDLTAAIVVFLVAIPLCIGIAMASGAPIFSGILSGIIGGIIVGFLSDSHVSVSGPAAGMIVVVLSALAALGSFHAFLLALFFAGVLQVLIGFVRIGFLADYIPTSVVQGLLAAIGLLIILKELPMAVGHYGETHVHSGSFSFTELWQHFSQGALIISFVSLLIMIYWKKLVPRLSNVLPAAIIVVVAGVVVGQLLSLMGPSVSLQAREFINLPVHAGLSDFFSHFQHPSFSDWQNSSVYLYGLIIAVVASIETLLNLEASEKIDPHRRYSSRNKELVAQGCGNVVAGLTGGIPITSVIIRSSVNIQSGNKTKGSSIIHGFFLLAALLFASRWLNLIPVPALAMILIVTGYKLTRFSLFCEIYQQGYRQFIPFVVTVFVIVFFSLLTGVLAGLGVSCLIILMKNTKAHFLTIREVHASGHVLRIQLPEQVSFLAKASVVQTLEEIPDNSKVVISALQSRYIDLDILNVVREFASFKALEKNIQLNLEGFRDHYDLTDRTDFITATTCDVLEQVPIDNVLSILKEGNERFVNNTPIHKNHLQHLSAVAGGQHPIAIVLSCIDSRVPIELIFDANLGDLFVTRVAGNILNDDILASIEYACHVVGTKVIVVLGHENCGAIHAACDHVELGHITQLVNKIQPAIDAETSTTDNRSSSNPTFVSHVCHNNVRHVQKQLLSRSEILKTLHDQQAIRIVGGVFHMEHGDVQFDV